MSVYVEMPSSVEGKRAPFYLAAEEYIAHNLHESELRPIINVQPNEEDCIRQLSRLVENRHDLPALHRQTLAYIRRHHDHLRVAAQYVAAWQKFGDR